MSHLLPRLPGPACDNIVSRFLENGPSGWAGFRPRDLPDQVRYAATGGTPVPAAALASLRESLVEIAQKHGFGREGGRQAHAGFDAETAALLAQSDLFCSGEALRDDVWSFVAAVLAPDIVYWRFGKSAERYGGGVRNTFQRLWMRGRALDRGAQHPERWRLLTELTEDALVQITERPSIGGDRVLALAVAEAWLRAARHHGKAAMEDIMRRAILRIRIRNEIRSLADLPPGDLASFLNGVFGMPEAFSVEAEPAQPGMSLADAVRNVTQEASRRRLLSPRARSALENLAAGRAPLEQRERNALSYLLGRLSEAGVLEQEIADLQAVLS